MPYQEGRVSLQFTSCAGEAVMPFSCLEVKGDLLKTSLKTTGTTQPRPCDRLRTVSSEHWDTTVPPCTPPNTGERLVLPGAGLRGMGAEHS